MRTQIRKESPFREKNEKKRSKKPVWGKRKQRGCVIPESTF